MSVNRHKKHASTIVLIVLNNILIVIYLHIVHSLSLMRYITLVVDSDGPRQSHNTKKMIKLPIEE